MYMEIHWDDFRNATHHRVTAGEATTVTGAIAESYDPFGVGHRVISSLHGVTHVFGHRAGHEQHIGVPGRSHEPDPKPLHVIIGIIKGMDFQLAAIARSGV